MTTSAPPIRKSRCPRFCHSRQRARFLAAGLGFALALNLALHAAPVEQPVVMMADLTKAGQNFPPPDREHPVYYRPIFFPYEEKGPPTGAWERKPDNETELRSKLAVMLASQGYRPANAAHPPSLVISFEWGSIVPNIMDPKNPDPDVGNGFVSNADEIRAIILGERARDLTVGGNDFGAYTSDMKTLRPRHYLVISAFQYQPGPHKEEILLWTVHTTANMWNNYLKEMMPEFISVAAAGVGRSVRPGPVFKTLVPHVSIGEATVVSTPRDQSK